MDTSTGIKENGNEDRKNLLFKIENMLWSDDVSMRKLAQRICSQERISYYVMIMRNNHQRSRYPFYSVLSRRKIKYVYFEEGQEKFKEFEVTQRNQYFRTYKIKWKKNGGIKVK